MSGGANRRLFFALWPDDATRDGLLRWQTRNLTGDSRWQHRADLHVTLHFLGQIEQGRLAGLYDLGARVDKVRFVLVLEEIGHWPRPQVLWAGPSCVPGELVALHAALGDGLRAQGLRTEERPFHPHVTLARKVREAPSMGPLAPLTWVVNELVLVESRPGDAPHYRPIARWPLG